MAKRKGVEEMAKGKPEVFNEAPEGLSDMGQAGPAKVPCIKCGLDVKPDCPVCGGSGFRVPPASVVEALRAADGEFGPVIKDGGPDKEISHQQQRDAVNDMTRQASAAMVPWAPKSVIEFHPTLAEIAKLKVQHDELLASTDVTTEEGYKTIMRALRTLTPLRTAVDKRRLEEGRQARDYVTRLNAAGKTIMERLEEIEAPLEAALKAQDEKEEREALEKARAIEAEQRANEEQRLALLAAEERRKKDEQEAELRRRQEAIDKEREEFELKKRDFEKQQQELREAQEKVRLENERQQREAQARIDQERLQREQNERIEREERERQERQEREEKTEQERLAQAERDRIANEARITEAKEKAAAAAIEAERLRVKRIQEAADAKAAKDKAAAEKKARLAPDIVKVANWIIGVQEASATELVLKDPLLRDFLKESRLGITANLRILGERAKKAGE